MARLITALLLVMSLCGGAWGATYYVDKRTGSDAYSAAQAQNSATPWASLRNPCDRTKVPNGANTISIVAGSGPYLITDLGALSQNALYPNQQSGSVITWEWNGNTLQTDINVNNGAYEWHQSTAGGKTTWYYLTAVGGGVPQTVIWDGSAVNLPQVHSAVVNNSWSAASTNLTNGTFTLYGRYATDNWSWGDYDSLGFSTLYVKYNNGVNPTGGNPVYVPIVDSIFAGGYAGSTHKHHNGIFRGANIRITTGQCALEFERCKFYNCDSEAIAVNSSTGTGQTYKAINCIFEDCGHSGIAITTNNNLDAYNNTFINVHAMIKLTGNTAYTVEFYNNASKNLLAGGIQHDNALPTLHEGNNQFSIDPNTTHSGAAIAITAGVRQWTITAATDIPASVATTTFPGTDGKLTTANMPTSISPLINAGTPWMAGTANVTDYAGYVITNAAGAIIPRCLGPRRLTKPDIGAYTYHSAGDCSGQNGMKFDFNLW